MNEIVLNNFIKAGEIHKNVENYIKPFLKENIKLIDICNLIENKIKEYNIDNNQLNNGIAFPTGICVNNIVAHHTPKYDDYSILHNDDVCKIDFGTHINGCMVDSAFTINLSNKYDIILASSKDAVDNIVKNIGIDVKFSELSAISKEVVESYEFNEKKLKPIDNICGHNILPWKIHGGKLLYGTPQNYETQIVEEDDIIAVEIFSSNGNGTSAMDLRKSNYSHFMLKEYSHESNNNNNNTSVLTKKTKKLFDTINTNFNTLPFCPRFIDNINDNHINYNTNYRELFENNLINIYPPIIETDNNAKVAQFETCVYVGTKKIVLS
jgi:methionyl aminopeptidase